MIVVDTNVMAYLYLPGPHTAAAEALLERDPHWCAPLLWRSELRNILAGYLRRGTLTLEQALATQREAEGLMAAREHDVDSEAVLRLVADSHCTGYDCEFVALARTLDTSLVTMDGQLLKAFGDTAVALDRLQA